MRAQSLIAQGKNENVAETLNDYEDAVSEALGLAGEEQILADTEEVQSKF